MGYTGDEDNERESCFFKARDFEREVFFEEEQVIFDDLVFFLSNRGFKTPAFQTVFPLS
jgi:hypothetical protein